MTTQETIFQSDQDQTKQTSQQALDQAQHLTTLVGDSRKYKTPDDLAKAYIHLDEHAEQLKRENAELRAKMAEAKTVEDVLERLNAPDKQNTQDQGGNKTDLASSLSANDVAAIVRDTLTGMETARSRQANLIKADAEMKRIYGEKATEMFEKEATTPALKKALIDLASVSPEKFVGLFHKETQQASGGQADGSTRVNSGAIDGNVNQAGRAADPGCKEYYNALRKANPKAYYSAPMQLQMVEAAKNSAKFYGS